MIPLPRVLLVEANALLCDLLRRISDNQLGAHWLQPAHTLADGIARCCSYRPDALILDLNLPDGDGWELLDALPSKSSMAVLVMADGTKDADLLKASRAPITGFLDKTASDSMRWTEAVRSVLKGRRYFCPRTTDRLQQIKGDTRGWHRLLSERELELMPLLARGWSDARIAERFQLRPLSVKTYRRRICGKLGLHSTVELIRWAADKGFSRSSRT